MRIKLCTCDPTHYAELLHCFDSLSLEIDKREGINAIPLCHSCRDTIAYNQTHWKLGHGNRIHFRIWMLLIYHWINTSLVVSEQAFNFYKMFKQLSGK